MNLHAHINKLRLQVSTPNPSTKLTSTLLGLFLLSTIFFPQPAHAGFFSQIKCFFLQIFTSSSCEEAITKAEVTPTPPTPQPVILDESDINEENYGNPLYRSSGRNEVSTPSLTRDDVTSLISQALANYSFPVTPPQIIYSPSITQTSSPALTQ